MFDQAAGWYGRLYGDRPVRVHLHDCDNPTVSPRRGVRIGGWVDLTVVGEDGTWELRQLDLWDGRRPVEDPLELEAVWVAVLRLARWAGDGRLRVSWADLLRGDRRERIVDVADEIAELAARFDGRVDVVRARVATPEAARGQRLRRVHESLALSRAPGGHRRGVTASRPGQRRHRAPGGRPTDPDLARDLAPMSAAWRNQYLLSIPASDDTGSAEHGRRLHDVLRFVHEHGSCTDADHVRSVVDADGGSNRLGEEIAAHAAPVPGRDGRAGWSRARSRPLPSRAVAALHGDGAHRRRVGARRHARRPRLQDRDDAGTRRSRRIRRPGCRPGSSRRSRRRVGLRLRLRYEYLSPDVDEDPPAWEPEPDELLEVEENLRTVVDAIRAEEAWHGVADATVCGYCRFRSICPDSAVTSTSTWPAIELDDAGAAGDA